MFDCKKLSLAAITACCFFISAVELRPYWSQQYPQYPHNFHPHGAFYYHQYQPQYVPYNPQQYAYPYGVYSPLNDQQQRGATIKEPTPTLAATFNARIAEDRISVPSPTNNNQNYGNDYPYVQTFAGQIVDEVINEDDLPQFLARYGGQAFAYPPQPQQQQELQQQLPLPQIQASQIGETLRFQEPFQQSEVKHYNYGPHVSSNSYVDTVPKKVTVIRSFPSDGSRPKVEIITDMSTKRTPTGTIITNDLNNESGNDDDDGGADGGKEVNKEVNEAETEEKSVVEENAIVVDGNSVEDESHPKPVVNWLF